VFVYYMAGILGGIAIIATGFTKFVWPMMRRIRNFLSDWEGEPPRQGVEERPGVMKRLQLVEYDVRAIKAEVHPNSGGSMKDQLTEVARKVDVIEKASRPRAPDDKGTSK
jgi:hypothetical protein